MIPFDYLDLFDSQRLQIPELETESTRFLLRLLIGAYICDPRGMGNVGCYTWCIPCEICCRNPSKAREVEESIAAIARACILLAPPARARPWRIDSLRAFSVQHDVRTIVRYFGEDGFDKEAYRRDRRVPEVCDAVTRLRYQLDFCNLRFQDQFWVLALT